MLRRCYNFLGRQLSTIAWFWLLAVTLLALSVWRLIRWTARNWRLAVVLVCAAVIWVMGFLTRDAMTVRDRVPVPTPTQAALVRMAPEPFDCTSTNAKVDAGDRLEQRRFANEWQELEHQTVKMDGYGAQFDIPAPSGTKYRDMRVVFNTVTCEYSLQLAVVEHFGYEHGHTFGDVTYVNATAALLKTGHYQADFVKNNGETRPPASPCNTLVIPDFSIKSGWPHVSFDCGE